MNDLTALIQTVKDRLNHAERVFVITGAGVSAESGVPTFRDAEGLWKKNSPELVATQAAFDHDPKFVWVWYDSRRVQLKDKKPNPAHQSLAVLERLIPHFFLLTQNVDDLHEQAGSRQVYHIHGSIWEIKCTSCHQIRKDRTTPLPELPPRCKRCGGLERPNVVWFNETIREDVVFETERFISQGEADLVLVIGTNAVFGYIGEWATRARGIRGTLVEINPDKTELLQVDIALRGKAGEILPRLLEND